MSSKKKPANKVPAKKVPAKKAARSTPEKKSPGRPTLFSKAIANRICDRLSAGQTLASICRRPGMPAVRTVSHWKEAHPEFLADFARAREEGYDAIADECLEIANTQAKGEIRKKGPKGTEITTEDMLGHRKLQIDTRLALLARWCPARYGPKVTGDLNLAGDIRVVIGGDESEPE